MIRISLAVFMLLFSLAQLWWLCLLLFLVYLYFFDGRELFFLAVLIDGYFGGFSSFPIVSAFSLVAILGFNWIKPRLLMYTRSNEIL
jgi:hypothetical protein